MSFSKPEAFMGRCPRCEEPILHVHCGTKERVSRFAVPYRDAVVLSKYDRCVWNVWVGQTQLYVTPWHYTHGKPTKGRIYIAHFCGEEKLRRIR